MMDRFALLVGAVALSASALAAEVGGVKLDDKTSLGGQEVVLNGAGIRTKAIFKVYVGSLYVPAKVSDLSGVLAKAPRRVQMNLLRNLSSDQLIEALVDGLKENNTPQELAAVKAQVDELVAIMKAIGDAKEGNVVTMDFVDGATRIGFNGTAKGAIAGEPFNRALMKIWLGDKPIQSDLKKALLGG